MNFDFKEQKQKIKKFLIISKKKLKKMVEGESENRDEVLFEMLSKNNQPKQTVDLSISTIFKSTLVVLFMIWLAQIFNTISDILIMIFVSFILAATFSPWVDWLEKRNIPRAIGILFIYIIIFGFFSLIIAYYVPVLGYQIYDIAREVRGISIQDVSNIPYYQKIKPLLDVFIDTKEKQLELATKLQSQLIGFGNSIFKATTSIFTFLFSIFGSIFNALAVLILTFYMVLENNSIEKFIASMFSREYQQYVEKHIKILKAKMGGWMRGQLLLMVLMGTTVFISLYLAGVPYSATFGLIAGFMELIPYVGGIITFFPAVIVGFMQSFFVGIGAMIAISVSQMLEGNVYLPLVMKKTVGLSPVITIIAMLVGGKIMGVGGIILSVPVAALISVFVNDYTSSNTNLDASETLETQYNNNNTENKNKILQIKKK